MIVQLPGGYHDGTGHRHREAELLPLSGREEELLADAAGSPAELVTRVLTRCVRRVGEVAVRDEVVRELTVGDRLFLLLKLREATFGPAVAAVACCPWPGCGGKLDLDFQISDVPVRESPDGAATHEVELSAAAAPGLAAADRRVRFRLPNGADQEALAAIVDTEPAAALRGLLQACVLSLGPVDPVRPEHIAGLSPMARAEIEAAMTAVAPGPFLTLELGCPHCARAFTLPFDVQDFFFGDARTSVDVMYRQVHYLAYHYHWSEAEILDLPRAKRLRYIEVLADEIERLNDALG